MAQSNLSVNSKDFTSIGVNDETWKSMQRDEARALLCVFAKQDAESRTLGTVLVSTPNGKELYVTPRLGGF
jgi:hypothetical protein